MESLFFLSLGDADINQFRDKIEENRKKTDFKLFPFDIPDVTEEKEQLAKVSLFLKFQKFIQTFKLHQLENVNYVAKARAEKDAYWRQIHDPFEAEKLADVSFKKKYEIYINYFFG